VLAITTNAVLISPKKLEESCCGQNHLLAGRQSIAKENLSPRREYLSYYWGQEKRPYKSQKKIFLPLVFGVVTFGV
jgi:hypothetical protein